MVAPVRWIAAAFVCACALGLPLAASADGTLPPQPYHYLHPPAAIKGSNSPPGFGQLLGQVRNSLSVSSGYAFTDDGQAGIAVKEKAFRTPASDTSYQVAIKPVETPPGLPKEVVADGNAYSFVATGQPSGKPAVLTTIANIILKWPHIPVAMYRYTGGKWLQVCYSDKAVFTPSTVACPTRQLGLFVAVNRPSNAGGNVPTTPVSNTPYAWINKYIPLIAAGAVVLLAVVLGYIVSRPPKR